VHQAPRIRIRPLAPLLLAQQRRLARTRGS
jgi:hypothetical protein